MLFNISKLTIFTLPAIFHSCMLLTGLCSFFSHCKTMYMKCLAFRSKFLSSYNYLRYEIDSLSFSIYCKTKTEAREIGNRIYVFLRDKLKLPINSEKMDNTVRFVPPIPVLLCQFKPAGRHSKTRFVLCHV